MFSILRSSGPTAVRLARKRISPVCLRSVSTLQDNPHIYVHKDPKNPDSHILSFLESEPPVASVSIGSTTSIPPTPDSFKENQKFRRIMQYVIATHCANDPDVKNIAKGLFAQSERNREHFRPSDRDRPTVVSLSEHAFKGAGVGGWVHISDLRNPPDINRSPDPEDIFGSVECDGKGNIVGGFSGYQACEAYRMVTRKGMITLTDYLRERLVEKLKKEEAKVKEEQK